MIEDLHIHTHISKDSKENPEKYVVESIKRGIRYLGFTDHLDLDPSDKDFGYYKFSDAYRDYIALKSKYEGKIHLLFGVEITYQSELEESIQKNIQGKPYDYIIGSVHRLDGYTIAGPRGIGFFKDKDEETAYRMYFDELYKMVNADFFQIVGHFDVIKRYGIQFYGRFNALKYKGIIKPILEVMVRKGIVMEVNSSGYRQMPKEPYPSKNILSMYAECGGSEITLGSDAHSIKQFGSYLEEALDEAEGVSHFDLVTFASKKKIKLYRLSSADI